MGCCYSCEEDDPRVSAYTPRVVPDFLERPARPVNLISRPTPTVPSSRSNYEPKFNRYEAKSKPLYGEYKCCCGYFWTSRLSRPGKYQQCKRCKTHVQPKNQRELRPTDYTRDKDEAGLEHPQELCQMCQELGSYCGKYK